MSNFRCLGEGKRVISKGNRSSWDAVSLLQVCPACCTLFKGEARMLRVERLMPGLQGEKPGKEEGLDVSNPLFFCSRRKGSIYIQCPNYFDAKVLRALCK